MGWDSGECMDGQAQWLIRCGGKEEEAIRNKFQVPGVARVVRDSTSRDGGTGAGEVQDNES